MRSASTRRTAYLSHTPVAQTPQLLPLAVSVKSPRLQHTAHLRIDDGAQHRARPMQRGARLHQRRIMRVRTLWSVLERRGLTTSHVAADRAADLLEVELGRAGVSCSAGWTKLRNLEDGERLRRYSL